MNRQISSQHDHGGTRHQADVRQKPQSASVARPDRAEQREARDRTTGHDEEQGRECRQPVGHQYNDHEQEDRESDRAKPYEPPRVALRAVRPSNTTRFEIDQRQIDRSEVIEANDLA